MIGFGWPPVRIKTIVDISVYVHVSTGLHELIAFSVILEWFYMRENLPDKYYPLRSQWNKILAHA